MTENDSKNLVDEWFTTQVRYDGRARIRIDKCDTPLCGDAVVTLAADGHPEIEVRPDDGSGESVPGFVSDGKIRSPRIPPYKDVLVSTNDGEFRSDAKIFTRCIESNLGGENPGTTRIRLGALRSVFEVKSAEPPRYWVLPLTNFLLPMRPMHFEELVDHPLWRRSDSIEPETELDRIPSPLIGFLFDGRPGFIQRVPNYETLRDQLQNGTCRSAVTALMVGEVGAAKIEFSQSEPETCFPIHLLAVLSFAAGNRIGAPWLELRDANGRLCRRIHTSFGSPPYQPGFAALDGEIMPRATEHLLTQALQSPEFGKTYLHIALQRVVESSARGASLETRKVALSRAIECLCKEFQCGATDLSASLSADQRAATHNAIRLAAEEIEQLKASATDPAQRRDLERIAQRIRGAAQKENSFGHSTVALCEKLGFADGVCADHYFQQREPGNPTTWAGALSRLRGAVMHEGHLNIADGTYSVLEAGALIDHLHDLLTRMILKIIRYEGDYRSMTSDSTIPVSVNRVRSDLDPAELGFGVDRSV